MGADGAQLEKDELKVSRGALMEIEAALERYVAAVDAASLRTSTKH